jgi:hypothetical protein
MHGSFVWVPNGLTRAVPAFILVPESWTLLDRGSRNERALSGYPAGYCAARQRRSPVFPPLPSSVFHLSSVLHTGG